jgi:hypothetical protein
MHTEVSQHSSTTRHVDSPRPTEPTSALAALIEGNHRYLERFASADAIEDDACASLTFPRRPFALALVESASPPLTPRIFSRSHHDVVVVDAFDGAVAFAAGHDFKLIVVLAPMRDIALQPTALWAESERAAFDLVERFLRTSAAVRKGVAAGSVRVVAALLEAGTSRVRWLGEHPDNESLAQGA